MKKIPLWLLCIILIVFQMCAPKPQSTIPVCFAGKLVKRGVCGLRVIQLLSTPGKVVLYAENWTDTLTRQKYQRVFTVGNSCDFPASIKENEEFTFSVTTVKGSICVQCYEYTASPEIRNNIIIGCNK